MAVEVSEHGGIAAGDTGHRDLRTFVAEAQGIAAITLAADPAGGVDGIPGGIRHLGIFLPAAGCHRPGAPCGRYRHAGSADVDRAASDGIGWWSQSRPGAVLARILPHL